jgi:hypothetical protein
MTEKRLYHILDLIEEISKVDKMIQLHQGSDSALMLNQYKSQKLKLSSFLFKELLSNSEHQTEVIHLIHLFVEKFYKNELQHTDYRKNESFVRIEEVVSKNY